MHMRRRIHACHVRVLTVAHVHDMHVSSSSYDIHDTLGFVCFAEL
jgi:hypothetical protein